MNDGVSQCPSFSYWAKSYRLERDETWHPRNSALHRSDVYVSLSLQWTLTSSFSSNLYFLALLRCPPFISTPFLALSDQLPLFPVPMLLASLAFAPYRPLSIFSSCHRGFDRGFFFWLICDQMKKDVWMERLKEILIRRYPYFIISDVGWQSIVIAN